MSDRIQSAAAGLLADARGQTAIEWTLVLAAFGLPMIAVFGWLLAVLTAHYRMVSFFEALPFP